MTSEIDWTKAAGREKTPRPKHLPIETEDDNLIVDDMKFEIEETSNLWTTLAYSLIIIGATTSVLLLVFNWNSIFPSGISIDSDTTGLIGVISPFIIFLPIIIIFWYMFKRYI